MPSQEPINTPKRSCFTKNSVVNQQAEWVHELQCARVISCRPNQFYVTEWAYSTQYSLVKRPMPFRKISSTIRQLGWIEGGFYFLSRGFFLLTFGCGRLIRYHFVAQPIPSEGGVEMRQSAKSFVGFVDANDPLVAAFPRPSAVIKKRFKDGSICLAAKAGEKFAGYLWLAKLQYEEDEVRCLYQLFKPEESVFDFDVFVEPELRYGRTFARLWGAANAHLAAIGVRWSFSRIATSNTESIRSHARLGIQKLFTANFICLGRLQIMIANIDPFFHISLSERSRPTLSLTPPI